MPDAGEQQRRRRPTCAAPSPKISRRRPHSREGCISRPMTNRNITTPSSATCRMACGSVKRPRPNGPMARPARQVAEHRAEAEPLEDRHGDHARRQQRHHLDEIVSGRFDRHCIFLATPDFWGSRGLCEAGRPNATAKGRGRPAVLVASYIRTGIRAVDTSPCRGPRASCPGCSRAARDRAHRAGPGRDRRSCHPSRRPRNGGSRRPCA